MTSKMTAVQVLRMVRAIDETRLLDTEERAGAERLAIYIALRSGLTRNQVFNVLGTEMCRKEAFNLTDDFENVWNRAFNG